MRQVLASTGEVSVLWFHVVYAHSPVSFLDLLHLPFLTAFPSVLWVLCLAVPWVLQCISHTDISVALLPGWSCSDPFLTATRELIHFALTLLLAWVIYSVSPFPFLLHCGILEMTLNIRIIRSPLSPRGQLRRWVQTRHQLSPMEVKMLGDVLDISGHFCLHLVAHNNW